MAPGDAKLFFLFSFLLPLKYYWRSYLPIFPSFALLINIFIPIFLYILMKAFYNLILSFNLKKFEINIFNSKKISSLMNNFIGVSAIIYIFKTIKDFFSPWMFEIIKNDGFIFLLIYIFRRSFFKVLKNKYLNIAVFFIAVLIFLFNVNIYGSAKAIKTLQIMLMYSFTFLALYKTIGAVTDKYFNHSAVRKIKISELKEGTRPKLKYGQEGEISGRGVTAEQVKNIKKWGKQNKFKEIEIYQKFPFAIWMFLGVIITIIFKGSILHLLLNWLS